jgi:ketosteroid isomerase-like protein/predicted nucleotidyltransferase
MPNENADVVRRAYRAYADGDLAAMLGFVDPDLEWTYLDPTLERPSPQVCHGRHELERLLRGWAEHGLRAELEEVTGSGELVMVGVRTPGVDAHLGRRGDDRAYSVLTVREGRIVALRDCRDRQEALQLVGIPAAASAEEASRFAEALARSSAAALGRTVAGVILHGSLTLGDYVPGRSDVDLLVVVDDPLSDAQLDALAEAVERQRPAAPGRVDLRVVTRPVAASPTLAPPMEAYLELTPESGVQTERRHPGERDLVVELSVCRAHGRSLLGPAPAELIGAVPAEWLLAVGDAQLADWQAIGDDPEHAELTVLTACRVWRFGEEGRHCSKTAAGEWALRRDPTLQVVRAALRRRHGDPTAPIDPAQVQRLLALVRARLAEVFA